MSQSRKVAFVTGASRGIGRATAIALAEAGFDVALAARRMDEGEEHAGGSQSGSLKGTAEAVRAHGREALPIRFDLCERDTISRAVEETLAGFGRIDVLVNNAVYLGEAAHTMILDTPIDALERNLGANLLNQFFLTQLVLPGMIERKHGVIVNLISGAALFAPELSVDDGGWSFAYAAHKTSLHRLTGLINVEHGRDGILAFSLQPGTVLTESLIEAYGDELEAVRERWGLLEPIVPASAIRWLAENPKANQYLEKAVWAYKLCKEHGLVADLPELKR